VVTLSPVSPSPGRGRGRIKREVAPSYTLPLEGRGIKGEFERGNEGVR